MTLWPAGNFSAKSMFSQTASVRWLFCLRSDRSRREYPSVVVAGCYDVRQKESTWAHTGISQHLMPPGVRWTRRDWFCIYVWNLPLLQVAQSNWVIVVIKSITSDEAKTGCMKYEFTAMENAGCCKVTNHGKDHRWGPLITYCYRHRNFQPNYQIVTCKVAPSIYVLCSYRPPIIFSFACDLERVIDSFRVVESTPTPF